MKMCWDRFLDSLRSLEMTRNRAFEMTWNRAIEMTRNRAIEMTSGYSK